MPTIYWLCPHCGQANDDKDLAAECCQPAPERRWLCDECQASYGSRHDAIKCELAHLAAPDAGKQEGER